MARPLRQLTPEADALWADALARYEAGHVTVEDLSRTIGFSVRTIYGRIREARERREMYGPEIVRGDLDAALATNAAPTEGPAFRDPGGPEIDDGVFLALVDSPLDAVRPTVDPETGETLYAVRPYYDLMTDRTSLDSVGGAVLVGARNGASTLGGGGGHRLPSPRLEGQRLRRTRLGTGKIHTEETPKSEGRNVNDADKAEGVVFVQAAKAKAQGRAG